MRVRISSLLIIVQTALLAPWLAAVAQGQEKVVRGSPPPVIRERVSALERMIESRNDESLSKFWAEQFSPAAREAKSKEEWLADLKEIRRRCTDFGTVNVAKAGEWSLVVIFGVHGNKTPVEVELEPAEPHLFKGLRLGPADAIPAPRESERPRAPLTWESLPARLKAEEADGFAGSVLVVKDGKIVLHEAYGQADRERGIPNKPDTIFAIGSTPIDFTKAAVLKLEDMGKIKTSDPITRFLPEVPKDKQTITLDHLMSGRSGLRNFHGRPTDTDLDNAWLDRDTAVKRILEDELLFPPGTDHAHSHSAFGLLAAIVEVVSGQPIGALYRQYLFEPAGMTRTSLYEEIKASQDQIAIGYGGGTFSTPNSPNHWGKTSWLVMGSGGMVSTTRDLYLFNKALREGKVLSGRSAERYFGPGVGLLMGASEHGFVTAYTQGADTMFVLCTNVIGRDRSEQLIEDLAGLVGIR